MSSQRVTIREEEEDVEQRREIAQWAELEWPGIRINMYFSILYDSPVHLQPVLHIYFVKDGEVAEFRVCWDKHDITIDGDNLPNDGIEVRKNDAAVKAAMRYAMSEVRG